MMEKMRTQGRVLVSVFVLTLLQSARCCSTPPTQVSALIELYNATQGVYWKNSTNWEVLDPCINRWFGVFCDSYCSVTDIILPSNNLNGTIPTTVSAMPQLIELDMSENLLSGTLPTSFGRLRTLVSLKLSNNNLEGTIPFEIGSLPQLIFLELSNNTLSGLVPSNLANAKYLASLKLSDNLFLSPLPSFLRSAPASNVSVDLRSNAFVCPVPAWCSNEGDGSCEPCDSQFPMSCCLYGKNTEYYPVLFEGDREELACAAGTQCPEVPGLILQHESTSYSPCGQWKQCGVSPTKEVELRVTIGACSSCDTPDSLRVCFCSGSVGGTCTASCVINGPLTNSRTYGCSVALMPGQYYPQLSNKGTDGAGLSEVSIFIENVLTVETNTQQVCGDPTKHGYVWVDGDNGCPQPYWYMSVPS